MKDLDFDELDRAVNSLVGQADGTAGKSAKAESSAVQPAAPAPSAQPSQATQPPVQQVKLSSPPQTPSVSAAPNHRSGRLDSMSPARPGSKRFIDIVAPKPSLAPKISRTGATIQPASKEDSVPEPIKPTAPPADKPVEALEPIEVAPTPKPAPKIAEEAWPDPLDFHQENTAAAPGDSPFIPGAKVEKRPLGAFTPVNDEVPDLSQKELEEPARVLNEPEATEAPVAESNDAAPVDKRVAAENTEESQVPETPEEPSGKQIHESAMMSIPQQYRTTAKPVDESPRPVFDTKEYHPPLLESTAHAAHRSNPWGKLLVVLLVVAAVAVGGYVAFMYFVQNF